MNRGEGHAAPSARRAAALSKPEEEALIRTVLEAPKDEPAQPLRRKFALRGLESLVACVLAGAGTKDQ